MRQYGGYISAIKDGSAKSEFCTVEASSPMQVVSLLMQLCKQTYPETEGWYCHATSQADGVMIY